jgi:zinc protease
LTGIARAFAVVALALTAPSAAHAVDVRSFNLAKGQDVWLVSDRTLPMIAMTVSLPAGSAYDPRAKPGLAAFAADLLDEGAGKLNANAFQTALSNRAIRLSVTPERDCLVVSLVTLTDNAKDAFLLLGMALAQPRFDQDAIARVRAQILSGLAQQDEEPDSVAARGFYRAFFHDHPYAHPVEGNAASVSTINAGDLKNFAAAHWVGGGLKIAVSGDVDQPTLTALLKTAFGRLPLKSPPPLPFATQEGQPGVQVIAMDVPQPSVEFGLPGILRNDPDFLPAYVANYILGGGGFSSRLTNEVREKRGLTYDISTELETDRKAGYVLGDVATRRGAVQQTIGVIRDTLRDYAENGPTDSELADAKTYLTGSFPLEFGSNVGIADQLNTFQRIGVSVDYIKKRNALIDAITLDQIKRVAKKLFNPAKLTIVVAGSLGSSTEAPAVPPPPRGAAQAGGSHAMPRRP